MTDRGRFIVLEGGDASGKSTQVRRLAQRLREGGDEVVETFEPGATPLGARLRALLLDGTAAVEPTAEALLMAADRAQHVAEILRPALARGAWVVSDRFVPSSLAYQGIGRGLGVGAIDALSELATGGLEPDLVVVLDVSANDATYRLGDERDRLEGEGEAFAASVRHAYRALAGTRGWTLIDAQGSPNDVAEAIWGIVQERWTP